MSITRKKMEHKKKLLRILAIVLAFGITVMMTSCGSFPNVPP
jgi:hypothetical protein